MKEEYITKKESGWKKINEEEKDNIFNFSEEYISFLNKSKTERESCDYIVNELNESGFRNIDDVDKLSSGDKVYMINRNKSVYACVIGADDVTNGINFIGSHIDSPRLDLKPNPIYEDAKLALFKTHYYGGIKKYQWTAIPLAMHGVVVKTNGKKIDICIGENDNDPVFTISDLLPHLAQEQNEKTLSKAIEGEALNIIVGSIPDDNDKVKENILKLLYEKYGIKEIDFNSAEIELVPAFKAKSLGFDRSMVAGYGQDDRICSFCNLKALLDINNPKKTSLAIFCDKEEIGSYGNTGMKSNMIDLFLNELLEKMGLLNVNTLNKVYCNSVMLSADVGAGVDPNYQSVSDFTNCSFIGYGVELNKYTGGRGKSGSSDANAEFVAKVRGIFESNNIKYQTSELGKVDIGGGGTIAFILAGKGVDVIDCGVPIISMHSPYEISSKFDLYETYKAYKAFFESI